MAREQFQTLTEPMYYVLLALLNECRGVDIMLRVETLSKGRVEVGPGTLYALLPKLEKGKYIRQTKEEGRQRWYIITESGRELLEQDIARMKQQIADSEALAFKNRSKE